MESCLYNPMGWYWFTTLKPAPAGLSKSTAVNIDRPWKGSSAIRIATIVFYITRVIGLETMDYDGKVALLISRHETATWRVELTKY